MIGFLLFVSCGQNSTPPCSPKPPWISHNQIQNNGGDRYYDFHIVYSASNKVPVLYFRAYCCDGQPLALEDIEKDIPVNSAQLLTRSKWTFMTLEHPELKRPWFTLLPCGTNEWMKLLFLKDPDVVAQGRVPVESWFSVVGELFGLKIPIQVLLNNDLSMPVFKTIVS